MAASLDARPRSRWSRIALLAPVMFGLFALLYASTPPEIDDPFRSLEQGSSTVSTRRLQDFMEVLFPVGVPVGQVLTYLQSNGFSCRWSDARAPAPWRNIHICSRDWRRGFLTDVNTVVTVELGADQEAPWGPLVRVRANLRYVH